MLMIDSLSRIKNLSHKNVDIERIIDGIGHEIETKRLPSPKRNPHKTVDAHEYSEAIKAKYFSGKTK